MSAGELQGLGAARVYWVGAHSIHRVSGRPFQSPLGKLHSEGLALPRAHGWERVEATDPRLPGFALTTRKGADFPACGTGLPIVRQFPQSCTKWLDDKRLLWECLEAARCTHIAPHTWVDASAFLQQHAGRQAGSERSSTSSGSSHGSSPAGTAAAALWFVKHRHGVKGQSVYPFASLPPLLARLRALGAGDGSAGSDGSGSSRRGHKAFVVQQGVAPPLLLPDGRKFTLRAHVLVLLEQQPHGLAQGELGQQRPVEQQRAAEQQEQQQPASEQQQQQQQQQQPVLSDQRPQQPPLLPPPHHQQQQSAVPPLPQQQQQQPSRRGHQGPLLRAYVHEDVIIVPHAQPASRLCAAGQPAMVAPAGQPAVAVAPPGVTVADAAADIAVHVSSRGKGHPCPFLLDQLAVGAQQGRADDLEQQQGRADDLEQQQAQQQPATQQQQAGRQAEAIQEPLHPPRQQAGDSDAALRQQLWQQVCAISRTAVAAAAQSGLVPARSDPRAVLYHLFAFDFAVAVGGGISGRPASSRSAAAAAQQQHALQPRVLLLEANSYPALASGTMAAVPRAVYTRLVAGLLGLVVLPALGSADSCSAEQHLQELEAATRAFHRVL